MNEPVWFKVSVAFLLLDSTFYYWHRLNHRIPFLRMPFRLERVLNKVFVTPRMHGLHHSVVEEETNFNYSTIFSWWDRLNRSFRIITEAHTVTIGVPAYRDASEQCIVRLLTLPFEKQRSYWRTSIASKGQSEPH